MILIKVVDFKKPHFGELFISLFLAEAKLLGVTEKIGPITLVNDYASFLTGVKEKRISVSGGMNLGQLAAVMQASTDYPPFFGRNSISMSATRPPKLNEVVRLDAPHKEMRGAFYF
jgi:hypothetical protein